jgi:hypothetical protein
MASVIEGSKTVSTTSSMFVAPFYANIDVSANSSIQVSTQQTVTMSYDLSFNYTLDEVDSAKLVNAFVLSQDASGSLIADVSNNTDFIGVMRKVILDASNNDTFALSRVLYNKIFTDLSGVYGDNIANDLESDYKLTVTVDASGGATNLWDDMKAEPEYPSTIALQIPNSNFLAYCDASENIHTNALPLVSDDVLVFLFAVQTVTNVETAVELTPVNVADYYGTSVTGLTGPATTPSNGNAATNSYKPVTNTVEKKIQAVAFFVKVTGSVTLAQLDPTVAATYGTPSDKLIGGARVATPTFADTATPANSGGVISGNTGTNNIR